MRNGADLTIKSAKNAAFHETPTSGLFQAIVVAKRLAIHALQSNRRASGRSDIESLSGSLGPIDLTND
jgi:hypothetical protein